MRISLALFLATLAIAPAVGQNLEPLVQSPLEPAGTGGVRVVDAGLAKLATHKRLLVVGAHPDDEDTTILAYVSSALGGEAAYLSLSRGEGGQNLIGPELGTALGLIRTGELVAARRVEGTRQYFTRAYDFGYTRSLAETFEHWPRESLLADAVEVIRAFKPQIIVAIFPADERSGHGQHQAAGVIAQEAFELAGLPDRLPDLTDSDMPPWQPQILYRRVWRNREEASFQFPLDHIEPFTGWSVLQIAGASRSKHRSQDMGTLQPLGSRQGGLIWVQGEPGRQARRVFDGVDTSLAAIAELLPAGDLRDRVRRGLSEIAEEAVAARRALAPTRLGEAVMPLARILDRLAGLHEEVLGEGGGEAAIVVKDLLFEKREVAARALAAAAGVAVDAVSDREAITIGDSFEVTASVWNSGREHVVVEAVSIDARQDWIRTRQEEIQADPNDPELRQWIFEMLVPQDSAPTVQDFLARPRIGDLYDWRASDQGLEDALSLQAPPVSVRFHLRIRDARFELGREVVFRERDQALGEVRRPIRAVPEVEVSVTPRMLLWSQDDTTPREIEVLVRSHADRRLTGRISLRGAEQIWPGPVASDFRIDRPEQQVLRLELPPPGKSPVGRIKLMAIAELDDGREFAAAYPRISYPHIRPVPLPVEAAIEIQRLDLNLPDLRRIGYVRGASDRVPEVLAEIGLAVDLLEAGDLRTVDLSSFDTIVIGSRAYETDPVLAQMNGRLLRYVEDGGLLLVQYQQYQFARGGFSPLSLEIARPHGRVTDETAPIEVLNPEHPLFQSPNRITAVDWMGWVQERGLYFAADWDSQFQALLSLRDEGREPEEGSLLVAQVGRGHYIYTGLSFFRQLPAGVPGAIRLFVNLMSWERS